MQKITIGIALALSLVAGSAVAKGPQRTAATTVKEMQQAVNTTLKAYKNGGVSGLIAESAECWEKSVRPYCLYLDMSGDMIDAIGADRIGAPEHEYFDVTAIRGRAAPLMDALQLDESQTNEYLQTISTAMGGVLGKALGVR